MFIEADARYGDPYAIADEDLDVTDAVLLEDGDGNLEAHTTAPGPPDSVLYLVDGVRRTDFRAHDILDDGVVVRGLGGSYGVGAVACVPGQRPVYVEPTIERLLFWTHGHHGALGPCGGWEWQTVALATDDADDLLSGLQRRMRDREASLAGELVARHGGERVTVVRDGPLNRLYGLDAEVVGLVKSHHHPYLPAELHYRVPDVIAQPGQRTSLFRLRDDVWGCYLRLPTVGRVGPWAGIVRIDVPAAAGLAAAAGVADRVCGRLGPYAGIAHTDPRAPANLQPIGALEYMLRHRLGDIGGALRAARQAAVMTPAAPHTSTGAAR